MEEKEISKDRQSWEAYVRKPVELETSATDDNMNQTELVGLVGEIIWNQVWKLHKSDSSKLNNFNCYKYNSLFVLSAL